MRGQAGGKEKKKGKEKEKQQTNKQTNQSKNRGRENSQIVPPLFDGNEKPRRKVDRDKTCDRLSIDFLVDTEAPPFERWTQ